MVAILETKPLATVNGEAWHKWPKDLYIPPEALAVCLDQFEGPLDLLLYLIRKHNLDILDIPVFSVTQQYLAYIADMDVSRAELAAEYLVMAAYLVEIKSRLLLPRQEFVDDVSKFEDDPRADLVAKLLEYQRFQRAAQDLDELPRWERDLLPVQVYMPPTQFSQRWVAIPLNELFSTMGSLIERQRVLTHHVILPEAYSTRERMGEVLIKLRQTQAWVPFVFLLCSGEGRPGVVVTFLAVLELIKEGLVEADNEAEDFSVCAHEPP